MTCDPSCLPPLLLSPLLCPLRHCTHHSPHCYVPSPPHTALHLRDCMLPSPHPTTRCSSLSPLPPLMPSFSPGGREQGGWKVREDDACSLMDGFGGLPYAFHNTLASVLHDQIFFFSPSTDCPFVSQHYLPLSKVLSKCC